MRYSIQIYNYSPEDVRGLASHAERLGFDALWTGEHYVLPRRYGSVHPSENVAETAKEASTKAVLDASVRIYDPWFLLGLVAGATRVLKVGTAIVVAPLNHPLLLSRHSVTAQELSGGRFMLGIAAGWLREEFDALGIPFAERGPRLDETIDVLRKAWQGGYFSHRGRHFQFDELQITPHPVSVPLVCGGNSPPALRRAAKVGDAWFNSSNIGVEQAVLLRDALEAERRAAGTASRPFRYFVKPARNEDIPDFAAQGFEDIVLWGPNAWPSDPQIPMADKVAGLAELATQLGLTPRHPSPPLSGG